MSNFYIPQEVITPARTEPMTDSQMARAQSAIKLLQTYIRDAQSIQDRALHHEMFHLTERLAALVRQARGL